MKNLLIYTSKEGKFDPENEVLAKIQVDNSRDLGWFNKDIMVVTNFDWEYQGVKSIVIPNVHSPVEYASNKAYVIKFLLDNGMLPDDLYWYHDFDAFENYQVSLGMIGAYVDFAICRYGYKDEFQCGSFFFRPSAVDIFEVWLEEMAGRVRPRMDEKYLTKLVREGRVRELWELNITYNLTQRLPNMPKEYAKAVEPIQVVHFHPNYTFYTHDKTNLEIFMYGQNRIGRPIMSEGLIDIFKQHGVY